MFKNKPSNTKTITMMNKIHKTTTDKKKQEVDSKICVLEGIMIRDKICKKDQLL